MTTPAFGAWFAAALQTIDFDGYVETVAGQTDRGLARLDRRSIDRVVLAGCGDSLFAAMSLRELVRRSSRLDVRATPAMDLARYEVDGLSPSALVVALSTSGATSRVVEAAQLARGSGLPTAALVGQASSAVAAAADWAIVRAVDASAVAPVAYRPAYRDIGEFAATLLALAVIGGRLGCWRGSLDDAGYIKLINETRQAHAAAISTATAAESAANALAERLVEARSVAFAGPGPSHGVSRYIAAKALDHAVVDATGDELEEWAHARYLVCGRHGARSVTTIIAPPGRGLDRARECLAFVRRAGGVAVAVTAPGAIAPSEADLIIPIVAPNVAEWLTPLPYHVALHMAVLRLTHQLGITALPPDRYDEAALSKGSYVWPALVCG